MREDDEARIGRKIGAAYRGTPAPAAGGRERMLERIGELPPPRPEPGLWARMARGSTAAPMRLALAAAVVLVAGGALIGRSLDRAPAAPDGVAPGPPAPAETPIVRFDLTAPDAAAVTLVGDFNGWDREATPMRRAQGAGRWTVSVPLARGRHAYGFVVDGVRWVADPMAPLAPEDGFGGVNSVIVVNGPGAS